MKASMTIVQKRFTDRKPFRTVRLSKACEYDPMVKDWAHRWSVPVACLIEDHRLDQEDSELLRDLWAEQLLVGHIGGFFRKMHSEATNALAGRIAAVTDATTMEEFKAIDGMILDWRILTVLSNLSQEGVSGQVWRDWFDSFHEKAGDYYRARSRAQRKDPVEMVHKRKRDKKYRKSDRGSAKIKKYWADPEVKAKDAARKRARRAKAKDDGLLLKTRPHDAVQDVPASAGQPGPPAHPEAPASAVRPPVADCVRGGRGEGPPKEARQRAA